MTDTADIKALRPSERTKLGFVTDDNTGGYYVAECEECGQIFPSQTCDGGEQIADSGDYGDCYCPHCGFIDPLECDNANLVWNVQQLKIANLTNQLEAERQRADNANDGWGKVIAERDAAEQKSRNYEQVAHGLAEEIAALKDKLANPVVLPAGYSARAGHPFHEGERNVMIPNKHGDWLSRFEVEHAIHIAGFPFTVKDGE
ncbi:hypothetical protein [Rahnella contaminans]|uniref:hypothetical protein n=1 Tax=Rahnella contaminans TaxID=2703882 RepID=UPI0023DCC035|nr:hypothetical protein [Rahnella contaminans]MDF1895124.1 hypothetical protein [Rahnella contaminans]